ncbi:hypothetical protein ACWNT8_15600 (plasmid) [Pigmentibacter ruber]
MKFKGGRPLPKWSEKILYLNENQNYTLYELAEIFETKPSLIGMFFWNSNIKHDGYIKKHRTRCLYFNSSHIKDKYLDLIKNGRVKNKFSQEKFNKLTKLYVKHSSNKLKDLFEDLLA